MRSIVRVTLGSLAAFSVVAVHCDAQLLSWDVNDVAGNTNELTAQTVAANLTSGPTLNTLARVDVAAASLANSFNSTGWNTSNTFVEASDYVSFLLQPESGFQVSVTALVFRVTGTSTAPGTGRWGYRAGSDPFVFQPDFLITTSITNVTWDLVDFVTTDAVEFRFWAYGTSSVDGGTSASGGAIRTPVNGSGADLVLLGEVIPEPSTMLLVGTGLAAVLVRRRRA